VTPRVWCTRGPGPNPEMPRERPKKALDRAIGADWRSGRKNSGGGPRVRTGRELRIAPPASRDRRALLREARRLVRQIRQTPDGRIVFDRLEE
jgi:hypothetical protein